MARKKIDASGLQILNKFDPNSPILEHVPYPTFRTTKEKEQYWAENKRRCVEGYGDIPGTLYNYIQNHQIKVRTTGETIRPICRDVDLVIHQRIQENKEAGRPMGVLKGRGAGLSTTFGSLANHFMWTQPGCKVLMTSKNQSAIATLFSEKVMVTYNNLHPDIKGEIINKNETKASSNLKVARRYINKYGQVDVAESSIVANETTERPSSATNFSGEGAALGCYDELPLNKRKAELLRSSIECYKDRATGKMTGFLIWGGTCEETLTSEELGEFKKLIHNSKIWDTDILFLPFWMGMFMNNGHSSEKAGMRWWEQQYEVLDKGNDPNALLAFRKNNPRTLDDIFDLGSSGRWEEDVNDKIKLQHTKIITNPPVLTPCKLVEYGREIEMVPDKKGVISILENPRENVNYYVTIDGIAVGKVAGEETGSNVAVVVTKMFEPREGDEGVYKRYTPVLISSERPNSVEGSYRQIINIAKYYNRYGGLKGINIEANGANAEHFSTFLEREGMGKYMMNKRDLTGKGNMDRKKFFQYVTVDVREWQMRQANSFLRKHIDCIQFESLLNDMLKPKEENADILDAWLMFFIAAGPDFDKPVKPKVERVIEKIRSLIRDPSGRMVWA